MASSEKAALGATSGMSGVSRALREYPRALFGSRLSAIEHASRRRRALVKSDRATLVFEAIGDTGCGSSRELGQFEGDFRPMMAVTVRKRSKRRS